MVFVLAPFALLASLITFVTAVPAHVENRAPAQVFTQCTVPNTAALTFDDGPWVYIYDIIGILNAAGAKGTFFFNGNNWDCIYTEDNVNRVRHVLNNGHMLASHTWAHQNLATLNWDQIHHQLWLVEEALMKIAGVYPAFVRPPYGSYNDLVREAAGVRGQSLALWDLDSGDSAGLSAADSRQRYTDVANARPSTVLALNHEVQASTVWEVLPHAISVLQSKGYNLVTLAECLGMPAYQWTAAPQARDGTWNCNK